MKTRRTTKRALLSSIVSLILCFSMLLGSTFAWFTDSASAGINTIQSGNLDIVVSYATQDKIVDGAIPDDAWEELDENKAIFNEDALWEPGYTEVVYFKIENKGSLALEYMMSPSIVKEIEGINKAGDKIKLSEYLTAYQMTGDTVTIYPTREGAQNPLGGFAAMFPDMAPTTLANALIAETSSAKALSYERSLEAGETLYTTMAIFMPTTVGNDANHNGTDVPKINLGINFVATQFTSESDSFDDQYDADAEYPEIVTPKIYDVWDGTSDISWYNDTDTSFTIDTAEELAGFAQLVNGGETFEDESIYLGENIDLKEIQWTPIGNTTNYFRGTFEGQDKTIKNLTIDVNNQETDQFAGLFGAVKNAQIKNLTMADTKINAVGKKVRAAAVVGIADSDKTTPGVVELNFENIKVENCDINVEATSGSALLGGVVGYSYPANMKNITVSNLNINGKAEGNEVRAAAICGYVCGQNISNNGNTRMAFEVDTFNVKDVSIDAEGYTVFAGGYAPYTYYGYITLKDGTIDNLKIDVDAHEAFVGGLVGYFWRSDNGHNVENVNITDIDFDVTTDYLGETRVGGMVGTSQSPNTKYKDCSVSGKIVERCSDPANPVNYHAKVGGFVARTYEYAMQTYTNCVADVDVTSSNVAGGFVGNHTSTVSYVGCEAKGDVTADIAGGFAGRLTNSSYTSAVTFDGCKASGMVTGTNVAGGFIGSTITYGWNPWGSDAWSSPYSNTVTIKGCEITGTVSSDTAYCAGVVGEAKMAGGKEIILENVKCDITPDLYPN